MAVLSTGSEGHGMYDKEHYLAHYQVLGAKHGVRRYQNLDGSLTTLGREHYGIGPARGSKEAKKLKEKESRKEQRANKKAAKKAQSEVDEHEATMRYLRKHPKKLYKYRDSITEEDAKKLVSQIQFDRQLKDIRNSEIQRGWDKVNTFSKNATTMANLLDTSKRIYNTMAEVNNTLVESGRLNNKKLLKIGEKQETPKEDRSRFEKIVRTGTKEQILENIGDLTSSELENAMKRLKYEETLRKKD